MVQPPDITIGSPPDVATVASPPDAATAASPWTGLQRLHNWPSFWPQIMPTIVVQHVIPPVIVVNQHYHFYGQQLVRSPGLLLATAPTHVTPGSGGDVSEMSGSDTAQAANRDGTLEITTAAVEGRVRDIEGDRVVEIPRRERTLVLPPDGKRAKNGAIYSDTGFTSSLSMAKTIDIPGQRVIARSRRWSSEMMAYGRWKTHRTLKSCTGKEDSLRFDMCRGGAIVFFPHLIENDAIEDVRNEMMNINTFKQYKVRDCAPEPRLHVLYCSTKGFQDNGGFQYGRVTMESNPLETLPVISKIADKLAAQFALEDYQWNIGCHLLLYRDGKDSIHWHSDDTQGEDVVLSLTIDGPIADPRTICFQPAETASLRDGDEQIELYPIPGDGYSMDGAVQVGYVHAMLKAKLSFVNESKRMAIIFRNGISRTNLLDNGLSVDTPHAPRRRVEYKFGPMDAITEGKSYSRDFLFNCGAHRNDRGNVDGNKEQGCPSLIVCHMREQRDDDRFRFLTYVVGDHSRPLALLKSSVELNPIRVFRSSNGNRTKSQYFPKGECPKGECGKVVYRYDGLYYVIAAKNLDDEDSLSMSHPLPDARVFYLLRWEPCETMERILDNYHWLRHCHPVFEDDTHACSDKVSEELMGDGTVWDIDEFNDWNPLTISL